MWKEILVGVFASLVIVGHVAFAANVSQEEMKLADSWLEESFGPLSDRPSDLPFSFVYGGKSSKEIMPNWRVKQQEEELDNKSTRRTITYTDPDTGLVVRCDVIKYDDFPTVEYVLYFKNTGSSDTPIIENIQALDIQIKQSNENEFILHHSEGSSAVQTDYRPFDAILGPGEEKRITPYGGRPTNKSMPYFNVEMPGKTTKESATGIIIVVGWSGQWAAQFTRDQSNGLSVRAGQETTHFLLHAGEEVRTPSVVLQFWEGDYIHSQNIWRCWMVRHNMPRPGGKLVPPSYSPCSSHQFQEMKNANEENQKFFIDRYIEEGLKPDYWWMDAGWYTCKDTEWINTGTWEVDKKRFPNGLRAIADHAHARGVGTIVWFEPERVTAGSWLWENHPEWLLNPKDVPDEVHWIRQWKLLNLGNPQARQWLTDHVDNLINEQGIDLYRQDFNIDPLWFWYDGDTADRQGITEIRYVEGYLAYWDELIRRHPNMLIDTCASGGRRNDIETLRRSVPFLRSDYNLSDSLGNQCLSYGMALWIPYFGTGELHPDPYYFWSMSGAHLIPCYDMRNKDLNYDLLRRLKSQWSQVAEYFYLADYYPLMPYSLDDDVWMVWQYNQPEKGEGVVMAFRREHSYMLAAEFPLKGLDPEGTYEVKDLDKETKENVSGKKLMENGLQITIANKREAAVIVYKKR